MGYNEKKVVKYGKYFDDILEKIMEETADEKILVKKG